MADDPERLLQRYGYGDPRWLEPGDLTDSKLHPPAVNEFALPPKAPAEVRNDSTRPDAYVDKNVREFMPPTVFAGSYGLGRTLGTAYGDLRMGDYAGAAHALPEIAMAVAPMPGAKGPKLRPRELDKLGYYSQALEAAKAWPMEKGTPEQALAYLKKAGTKDAEIKATALDKYLAEQDGVITRQGLEDYLRKNRVELQEGKYGPGEHVVLRNSDDALMEGPFMTEGEAREAARAYRGSREPVGVVSRVPEEFSGASKWSEYSLDPSNPTYRESVLHLPEKHGPQAEYLVTPNGERFLAKDVDPITQRTLDKIGYVREHQYINENAPFSSGHWEEPNVMAHARTSVQRDLQGRPVYLIDELQSDWGQKIREGGVRDEAKIGELQKRRDEAWANLKSIADEKSKLASHELWKVADIERRLDEARAPYNLAESELRNAKETASGHPLVNTTDQWTTTAIRRLLQDAAEKDAAGIALTPGALQNERFNLSKQVGAVRYDPERGELQYVPGANSQRSEWGRDRNVEGDWRSIGPVVKPEELASYVGKETAEKLLAQPRAENWHTMNPLDGEIGGNGMRYAYDQMYPKMLEKQLRKLDPEHPGRGQVTLQATDNMEVPKVREIGKEPIIDMPFSYFELTPRVKEEIKKGLPLFSLGALTTADLLRRYYGEEQ